LLSDSGHIHYYKKKEKERDSKQNLTTYITRNVQQEAKEDYSGKVISLRKTDIVGAKTFETRGELNLNLHVLARRSRDKKQQQLQMHEREREREREREKQKR
jgi:hypothetical protein